MANSLVDAYRKIGRMIYAIKLFDQIPTWPNVESSRFFPNCYVQSGMVHLFAKISEVLLLLLNHQIMGSECYANNSGEQFWCYLWYGA